MTKREKAKTAKPKAEKARRRGRTGLALAELIAACILLSLGVILYAVCRWIRIRYNVSFMELLFTLLSPMKGANLSMVTESVVAMLPYFIPIVLFILVCVWIGYVQGRVSVFLVLSAAGRALRVNVMGLLRHAAALVSVFVLIWSCSYADQSLKISEYLDSYRTATTIYEDEYVDPNTVTITGPEKPKNLIYIYLESMETTYASKAVGGAQPTENYIPHLTELAQNNCSFSNSTALGGWRPTDLTAWTMAVLFATSSGVPMAFPVARNAMNERERFASGLTCMGELLEERGYQNVFLCGSYSSFGGRDTFYRQHGDYTIYDLDTAHAEGYIPEDYVVWWGYEDEFLYSIAQDKLTQLSQSDQPFNFTMLTVDTHYPVGYVCNLCGDTYPTDTENILLCADLQLHNFITWCQQQDFYEDTVIVIAGDHPRMDTLLVEDVAFEDRTIYNCFLNCDVPDPARTVNRTFTALDMFPTVMSAMGFQIDGERLGLGVNLFSDQPTLPERMGFEVFTEELSRYSPYYIQHFS